MLPCCRLLHYWNNVKYFAGHGGAQASPLDPIDVKVQELLGFNNETVDGVVGIDLDLDMRRVM